MATDGQTSEQAGSHANPTRGQHLVGQPWTETGGQRRRDQEGESSHGEAKAGTHFKPANQHQEEDRGKSRDPDHGRDSEHRVHCNQGREHRQQACRKMVGLKSEPEEDHAGGTDEGEQERIRLRMVMSPPGGQRIDERQRTRHGYHQQPGGLGVWPQANHGAVTGTSSGSSQPAPSSLLTWVEKTSESLKTSLGGPSA